MKVLKSLLVWGFIAVTLILFFFPSVLVWILSRPFDRRQVVFHQLTAVWAYLYVLVIPGWKIRIRGRENISNRHSSIIISNHQSAADIAVLFGLFRHFKWVSKTSNFRLPVIGWVMRLNGYIEVGETAGSIRRMLEETKKTLLRGNSVLIFPEGTRSRDLQIGRFRDGAFHLALETRLPIVPVVLDGTGSGLPKNGFVFSGKQRIEVRVFPEVHYDTFSDMSVKELREHFRNFLERQLNEMRAGNND